VGENGAESKFFPMVGKLFDVIGGMGFAEPLHIVLDKNLAGICADLGCTQKRRIDTASG